MFESVQSLLAEHEQLQQQLADPAIHADAARAKKVNRRYAELSQIVAAHTAWQQAQSDASAARELAREDDAFAEEVPALEDAEHAAEEKLRRLLIPRDPDDGRDVIMEIKGGEGGEESALFAADLLRMYLHYAESRGWKTELLERNESDLGGTRTFRWPSSRTPPIPPTACGRASSTRAACTACSACRRLSRRAASTPPRRACSCSPRSTRPKRCRSTRTI
ncbi:hypothetical protein GCM10025869_26820 [Homoserinibacter gongjuensis]|uniref:Peptide chain release factor domain-containing protein n=1 Tax=Homoserinibacter gongjuensis TaxID=1162968 RepID=A0ABQ6JVC2_9MICO|nr:hypothetical protein GCM10025869_26820 [Homoserinibacter gongjuensis]